MPDVPAPLPQELAPGGTAELTLEDAVQEQDSSAAPDLSAEVDAEQGALHPDDFLAFLLQHGWVRSGELEELRQTRAEAAQRLRDIEAGADGTSLAGHAQSTGGVPGGSASVHALVGRPGVVGGPASPTKSALLLPASPTSSPGGRSRVSEAGAITRSEQASLPTHRPMQCLLLSAALGLATTSHIPLTARPVPAPTCKDMLAACATQATSTELDAWLAVQRWSLQRTQDELLSVRRKLTAAYREATPEGVAHETGEDVSTATLHGAATAAADAAVAAYQQGPQLPEVGLNEHSTALLGGHKFVHALLQARTDAGKRELGEVLGRFRHLVPELQARVEVKREQDAALAQETADLARAVAQLRSAALSAGISHPHDIASGRAGGSSKDPDAARPLALTDAGQHVAPLSPKHAFERAASDVAAQYVAATRRAKESLGASAMSPPSPPLEEGDTLFKPGKEVQVEQLATMLEALGPEGAAAARERELAAVRAAAAAEVAAAYEPRIAAVRDAAQQAVDEASMADLAKRQSMEAQSRDLARQVYVTKHKALQAKVQRLQAHSEGLKLAIRRLEATAAGAAELTLLKARVRQLWAVSGLEAALPEDTLRWGKVPQPSYLSPLPAPQRSAINQAVMEVVTRLGPQSQAAMTRAEALETGDAAFQQFAKNINAFLASALLKCNVHPKDSAVAGAGPPGDAPRPSSATEYLAPPLTFSYDSLLHDALKATKHRIQLASANVTWTRQRPAEKALAVAAASDEDAQHSPDGAMHSYHVAWPSRSGVAGRTRRGKAGHDVALMLSAKDAPLSSPPASPRRDPHLIGASAGVQSTVAKDGTTAAALQHLDGSTPSDTVGSAWDDNHIRYFKRTWSSAEWSALSKTFANSACHRRLLEVAGEQSDTPRTNAIITQARFGVAGTGGSQPGLAHIHQAYQYDSLRTSLLAPWAHGKRSGK